LFSDLINNTFKVRGLILLIVKKFGGSSLANIDLLFNAAKNIVADYRKKNNIVVVLSAIGDRTDELIKNAKEINPNPSKRELDMLLVTGEMQSVAFMAMAIHKLGYPAISLSCVQAKIFADDIHGNARIQKIDANRIQNEIDKNNIVIVTGFQAINFCEDFVTLGRGGSDTSAVALSVALNADQCEIYTDVDGIYTADPRIIPCARKIKNICYDEMLELASQGTVVMHNRSIELAKNYNMQIIVRSSLNNNDGTIIGDVKNTMEKTLVSGIATDKNIAVIYLVGLCDNAAVFKLFSLLSRSKISIDLIIQSIGLQEAKDISFTVADNLLDEVVDILEKNNDFIRYDHLTFNKNVAKLSVIGSGLINNPEIAKMTFEAIYNEGINIRMISTSEIKLSILVDEKDLERASQAVHKELIGT
jgi:aspartate kinase